MKDKIFDHVKQECYNITSGNGKSKARRSFEDSGESEHMSEMFFNRLSFDEIRPEELRYLEARDDCEALVLLAELFCHNKEIIYN